MMSSHSDRRKAAIEDLDRSLSEAGGSGFFTVQSAMHIVQSVRDLEKNMRSVLRPSVFSDDKGIRIDDQALQQSTNNGWLVWYSYGCFEQGGGPAS